MTIALRKLAWGISATQNPRLYDSCGPCTGNTTLSVGIRIEHHRHAAAVLVAALQPLARTVLGLEQQPGGLQARATADPSPSSRFSTLWWTRAVCARPNFGPHVKRSANFAKHA